MKKKKGTQITGLFGKFSQMVDSYTLWFLELLVKKKWGDFVEFFWVILGVSWGLFPKKNK